MASHQTWRLAVIVFTGLVYLGTVAVSTYFSFAGDEAGFDGDSFATKILPASWVFAVIWGGIYVYSAVWLIYAMTTLCRRSTPVSYLYYDPPYLPVAMYFAFSAVSILGAIWLYVANSAQLWDIGLIVISLMLVAAMVAFISAFLVLAKHKETLKQYGKGSEIGWTIALVHNGLGMYATWLAIATLQNLAIAMFYYWDVEMDTTCYICLSALLLFLLIWFVLDNFICFEKTKYIFTPYIVLHVALGGIIDRNMRYGQGEDPVNQYVIALLGIGAFSLVFKVVYIFVKNSQKDRPNKLPRAIMSYPVPNNSLPLGNANDGVIMNYSPNYGFTIDKPVSSYNLAPVWTQQPTPVAVQQTLQPIVMQQIMPQSMPVIPFSQPQPTMTQQNGPIVMEKTAYGLAPLQQMNPGQVIRRDPRLGTNQYLVDPFRQERPVTMLSGGFYSLG